MTGTVELRHLIAGEWRAGAGSSLLSVNPARPTIVVAQGDSATTADLETAVDAARAARAPWAGTPIHQRGAILLADGSPANPPGSLTGIPPERLLEAMREIQAR